ncbi:MAG TPA: SDR family NAD(P)-dependent oxidoreductase, partial [Puia sp.]|nr:SDR family NAD(P)-dependent oxidoreductase [Puia sp.]
MPEKNRETKKVWLVTGSSRGLGRALVEAVLAAGDLLIATARKIEQLDALRAQYGDQVLPIALDVTQPRDAAEVIKTGIAKFGHIDVLVNNAGFGNIGSIEETSLEEFHEQIETNLFGVINLTKAVLPYMREQRSGHIINLSSIGGRIGSTGRAPYSAAKFGVEGFSEVLANEMRPLNVKVTIIEPGGFRTDFAGASTTIHEVRPEYDPTVGRAARFQKEYDGHHIPFENARLSQP